MELFKRFSRHTQHILLTYFIEWIKLQKHLWYHYPIKVKYFFLYAKLLHNSDFVHQLCFVGTQFISISFFLKIPQTKDHLFYIFVWSSINLNVINSVSISDQGKDSKLRISSYFFGSFSVISSPCTVSPLNNLT